MGSIVLVEGESDRVAVHAQLRRFMGSGARRKIRYGRLLVEALEPHQVPRPLEALFDGRARLTVSRHGR